MTNPFVDDCLILTVADWSIRHRLKIKVSSNLVHTVSTSSNKQLDEYVWKIDENYRYEYDETNTEFKGVTGYTYVLYSQQWLNESFYYLTSDNGTVWSHQVTIWIPDELDSELSHAAFLAIGGGNHRDTPGYNSDEQTFMRALAVMANTVTVYIS